MGITVSSTLSPLVGPQIIEAGPQSPGAVAGLPADFSAVLNGQLASLAGTATGTELSITEVRRPGISVDAELPAGLPFQPAGSGQAIVSSPLPNLSDLVRPAPPTAPAPSINPITAARVPTSPAIATLAPTSPTTAARVPSSPGSAVTALSNALDDLAKTPATSALGEFAVNRKILPKTESAQDQPNEARSGSPLPAGLESLLPVAPAIVASPPGETPTGRAERSERKLGEHEARDPAEAALLATLQPLPPGQIPLRTPLPEAGTAGLPAARTPIDLASRRASPLEDAMSTSLGVNSPGAADRKAIPPMASRAAETMAAPPSFLANLLPQTAAGSAGMPNARPEQASGLNGWLAGNPVTVVASPEPAIVAAQTETVAPGMPTSPLSAPPVATTPVAPGATPPPIAVPVHAPQWNQELGDRVVWMARNEVQTAQINITPAQLGPIQITINLNGDQASAVFTSPYAEVRQVIQDSLPHLRDMLASAGINLGQSNVGTQHPQQQQEAARQFANANRSHGETDILPPDAQASAEQAGRPLQRGRGLVDLFA